MQPIQTQRYDRMSLLSLGILAVLTWGFYRTYLMFFPTFEGFQTVHHAHGIVMLLWIGLLIIQPWLMSRKKYKIHRTIGKVSFVLAPLVILSIFSVSNATYYANLQRLPAPSDAVALLSISIPPAFIFGTLYGLAITNRRRTYYHMRYMMGTGILMIGPGLGRLIRVYVDVPMSIGGSITLASIALLGLLFLGYDMLRKQDYVPNLVVAGLFILHLVLWQLRYTIFWQRTGETFVDMLF